MGDLGKIVTGIKDLDGPVGIAKDFAQFNLSVVAYLKDPTPEVAEQIEQYGIKFGLSATGTTLAGALAVEAELSGGWILTSAVAAAIAAEYATKALISQSRLHPVPKTSPKP